jgi:hypothetical protein
MAGGGVYVKRKVWIARRSVSNVAYVTDDDVVSRVFSPTYGSGGAIVRDNDDDVHDDDEIVERVSSSSSHHSLSSTYGVLVVYGMYGMYAVIVCVCLTRWMFTRWMFTRWMSEV